MEPPKKLAADFADYSDFLLGADKIPTNQQVTKRRLTCGRRSLVLKNYLILFARVDGSRLVSQMSATCTVSVPSE